MAKVIRFFLKKRGQLAVGPEKDSRFKKFSIDPRQTDMGKRLSPERLELLERTRKIRHSIGRVSINVGDILRQSNENGQSATRP
jgi:hypothetical protein